MRLTILERGIIKSGYLDYTIDEDGTLHAHGEVKVKVMKLFTKTFRIDQDYQVIADDLKSKTFVQGAIIDIGPIVVTVDDVISPQLCKVFLQLPNGGTGTAAVKLGDEFISIEWIDIKATVQGKDLEIYATE